MRIHVSPDAVDAAAARAAILDDECLSYAARGLLLAILKNAPEWEMNADRLSELTRKARGVRGEGKSVLRGLFRELHQARYLTRTIGGGAGRQIGTRVDVYDTPLPLGPIVPKPEVAVAPDKRRGDVVYVIAEPGSSIVKIGTTSHIRKRLIGLQGSCPVPLEVRWTAPGDGRTEALLHSRLARYRRHGEWFDFGRFDAVKLVQRQFDRIKDSDYEEMERQLAEYGAVVDYSNL